MPHSPQNTFRENGIERLLSVTASVIQTAKIYVLVQKPMFYLALRHNNSI